MTKRRGPAPKWRREQFEGVPGSPEVSIWHVPPRMPLRITQTDIYRDGGTAMMTVRDSADQQWTFCFDRFLGRLCTGAHPNEDDAAFIRPGSQLEADLFTVMARTVQHLTHRPTPFSPAPPDHAALHHLPDIYARALVHSGQPHTRQTTRD
ncbi:hypothetical protein SMC26_21935 [Actinomadura fulvescens]|uniref:Uncharacterized protein n=1 Tax=Actinomadura fulvescens TaxID=46160 RepID=A0ABP6D1G0_9ACTN